MADASTRARAERLTGVGQLHPGSALGELAE